ncbi:hypothetical protein QR685DRAFT_438039, partial [Neurospora intermedia]
RAKLGIPSLFGSCVLRGVHGKSAISYHFSCHITEVKEMKKKVTPHMAQTAKVSPRKGRNQKEGTKIEVGVEVPGVYLPHGYVHG